MCGITRKIKLAKNFQRAERPPPPKCATREASHTYSMTLCTVNACCSVDGGKTSLVWRMEHRSRAGRQPSQKRKYKPKMVQGEGSEGCLGGRVERARAREDCVKGGVGVCELVMAKAIPGAKHP